MPTDDHGHGASAPKIIQNILEANVDAIREAAIDRLAASLYRKMEHLEPTTGDSWDELTDCDRDFYLICVKALANERASLAALLFSDLAHLQSHSR